MTRRVINVETGTREDGPGFVLDVYEVGPRAYRGEVRDPEENIVMAVASAKLDGDASLLESVTTFFASGPLEHIGKMLAVGARAELKMGTHEPRPATASGLEMAGVVLEALSPLLDAHPDIGADALGAIAASVAVELQRRFRIEEKS